MDVGRAITPTGNAYFLESAGVGIDAGMFVYGNQLDAGNWRALRPMVRYLLRFAQQPVRLTVGTRREYVRALMITVAITPYTGAAFAVAPDAKIDDRHFDVVVRETRNPLDFLRHVAALTTGWARLAPRLRTLRGRRVSVEHRGRKLLVHADGHPLGTTPARFELMPGALRVLVGEPPAGQPSAIAGTPALARTRR
jgi:diacylglycerol kinase family enzyme